LEKLDQHSAKATFLHWKKYRSIPIYFEKLIEKKHSVGNHTFDHLNGWKTTNNDYNNISLCENSIKNNTMGIRSLDSKIFRPPYGKIKSIQAKIQHQGYKIIMWDVLSADFDQTITRRDA
jgi:peptidoglycan/xylan/chitin deacetylase (PgdA/CDA1 family)